MIKIATLPFNAFGENTYILIGENKDCFIVDAGCYSTTEKERLKAYLAQNELKPVLAINTHAHIDHVCGVEWVKSEYGVDFALSSEDMPILEGVSTYGEALGFNITSVPSVERELQDGDELELSGDKLQIIATPGHTAGGICIYIPEQKMLVTGDTLFKESIGRTDLPTGNYPDLMTSIIKKLLPLGSDVTFFPGHGPSSTLGFEMERNPFICEVMSGDMTIS